MAGIDTDVYADDSLEYGSRNLDSHSESLLSYAYSNTHESGVAETKPSSTFTNDERGITKASSGFGKMQRSTPTSTSNSTQTTTDALTTPFVYAASCTDIYYHPSQYPTILAAATWLEYSHCQPRTARTDVECRNNCRSWDGYVAAVCPTGNWALDVGLMRTSTWDVIPDDIVYSTFTVSTAYCCASGEELSPSIYLMPVPGGNYVYDSTWNAITTGSRRVCVASWDMAGSVGTKYAETRFGLKGESFSSEYGPGGITKAVAWYPAWNIQWVASDLSSLSPKWPISLTSNMLIPTWTENMPITSGVYDNRGSLTSTFSYHTPCKDNCGNHQGKKQSFETVHLIIIITVIAFFMVFAIGCIICCACRQHLKTRHDDERERTGTCRTDNKKENKRRRREERDRDVELQERELQLPLP